MKAVNVFNIVSELILPNANNAPEHAVRAGLSLRYESAAGFPHLVCLPNLVRAGRHPFRVQRPSGRGDGDRSGLGHTAGACGAPDWCAARLGVWRSVMTAIHD